jgi:hypothetical protein
MSASVVGELRCSGNSPEAGDNKGDLVRCEARATVLLSLSRIERDRDRRLSVIEFEALPLSISLDEDGTGDESIAGGRDPSVCGFVGVVNTEDEDLDCDRVSDCVKLIFNGKPYTIC